MIGQFLSFCEPTPPSVFPDTHDTGVQCCVDTHEYSAFLTKQFVTVANLERGFNGARKEVSDTLDNFCEQVEKSQALEDANKQLKHRLPTLATENESLLKRTFEITDKLGNLRSLAASHRRIPVFQRMELTTEDAPDNLLFDLLGCTPAAYTDVLQRNIRVLLHTLHPDKNKAVSVAARKYLLLNKEAKRILSISTLKTNYVCCGMPGVRRSDMALRTCHH